MSIKKPGKKIMIESSGKNQTKIPSNFCIAFIRCSCENELLIARYDGEFDTVELSIYEAQNSFKNRMSLWEKICYIYKFIKNGQPYTDQIVLNRNQINELNGFLNSI